MKKVLIFVLSTFIIHHIYCQNTPSCGTPAVDSAFFWSQPWVGNNQYLLNINDSIGYPATIPQSIFGDYIEGGFDDLVHF